LSYAPSIDSVMEEVARRYGANGGAIIFSGMGDDGARGCQAVAGAGGLVWAQDSASCAIDSMPSCARNTGVVAHSAPPEALARDLAAHLAKTAQRVESGT
ncbi:chemotaxis protein CheB, partial [Alkalilimnicola sp. S0819]|uniref:chemotaxis protein CheB n=1 Tax=Alkalilimnicola sp. S0819 TaxID=2613922 RepID=UPI00132837F0